MRNENIEWITIRKADFDALAARLAEVEALLREIRSSASPVYAQGSRYEVGGYVKDYKVAPHLVHRINAHLKREQPVTKAPACASQLVHVPAEGWYSVTTLNFDGQLQPTLQVQRLSSGPA